MSVEQFLEKVRLMDEQIDLLIDKRDRLKALATDISAKPITDMPMDHCGTVSQKMQDAVIALIELEHHINKKIDAFVNYKHKVITALNHLPLLERTVLYRHYILYQSWSQVAQGLNYSRMHLWRIRQNGYKILEKGLECYYEM